MDTGSPADEMNIHRDGGHARLAIDGFQVPLRADEHTDHIPVVSESLSLMSISSSDVGARCMFKSTPLSDSCTPRRLADPHNTYQSSITSDRGGGFRMAALRSPLRSPFGFGHSHHGPGGPSMGQTLGVEQ
jgi:hypothetical protein